MKDPEKTRQLVLSALISAASGKKVAILCVKQPHVEYCQRIAEKLTAGVNDIAIGPGIIDFSGCDGVGEGFVLIVIEERGIQEKLESEEHEILFAYNKQ